jgi:hypothetical protein
MDLKTFRTDNEKEQDGTWVDLGDGVARLKIARMNNPRYREAQQRKLQRYKMAARSKVVPDDVWEGILNELIAETILVDWEGITMDGDSYPYSIDHAKQALTDLKDFREMVLGFADDIANFKEELDQATEKNSVRP